MELTALLCGSVLFPGLFYSFRKLLRSTFTQWNEADVVCVSERLVSAIHASMATGAGVVVVTSCKDVMTGSHWLANGFVWFGAPYMANDIYAMYLSHYTAQKVKGHNQGHSLQTVKAFLIKDWMLFLHHSALLLIFMPITLFFRGGLGDFFVGCLFITELSSIFLSIGKILFQLGLHDTRLQRINGIILLVSFFTCRILVFPFMYLKYGRQYGLPLYMVPFHLPLQCNVGNLVILAPQVYWFMLLLRKAQQLYHRQRPKTE
ncbi:TLC domain-containing protein 3A-like [Genypterus blacodes]|uniref:TLC domain-containing protein 3A-like n=1 Tax=Genypterus blacodes TaxID=154954 RepID=UPI003F769BF0